MLVEPGFRQLVSVSWVPLSYAQGYEDRSCEVASSGCSSIALSCPQEQLTLPPWKNQAFLCWLPSSCHIDCQGHQLLIPNFCRYGPRATHLPPAPERTQQTFQMIWHPSLYLGREGYGPLAFQSLEGSMWRTYPTPKPRPWTAGRNLVQLSLINTVTAIVKMMHVIIPQMSPGPSVVLSSLTKSLWSTSLVCLLQSSL